MGRTIEDYNTADAFIEWLAQLNRGLLIGLIMERIGFVMPAPLPDLYIQPLLPTELTKTTHQAFIEALGWQTGSELAYQLSLLVTDRFAKFPEYKDACQDAFDTEKSDRLEKENFDHGVELHSR